MLNGISDLKPLSIIFRRLFLLGEAVGPLVGTLVGTTLGGDVGEALGAPEIVA